MLSVKAAAVRAGVCTSVVYGWIASKILPHFRLGAAGKRGKIAIEAADLDAFMASLKVDAVEASIAPAKPREYRHLMPRLTS